MERPRRTCPGGSEAVRMQPKGSGGGWAAALAKQGASGSGLGQSQQKGASERLRHAVETPEDSGGRTSRAVLCSGRVQQGQCLW